MKRPVVRPPCAALDCEEPATRRSLCLRHYGWARRWGIDKAFPKQALPTHDSKICKGPECGRRATGKGYCNAHGRQLRKGEPLRQLRKYAPRPKPSEGKYTDTTPFLDQKRVTLWDGSVHANALNTPQKSLKRTGGCEDVDHNST
jgi:hypothetical protein